MNALGISLLLILYSFALCAQEIGDAQVQEEMKIYLTHLNGDGASDEQIKTQLGLMQTIKSFWKMKEFHKLRELPLNDILRDHRNDPYFLSALALNNEDVSVIQKRQRQESDGTSDEEHIIDPQDTNLVQRAIDFRIKLRAKDLFEKQSFPYATEDFTFDKDLPSMFYFIWFQSGKIHYTQCQLPGCFNDFIKAEGVEELYGLLLHTSDFNTYLTPTHYIFQRDGGGGTPMGSPNVFRILDFQKKKVTFEVNASADIDTHALRLAADQTKVVYVPDDKRGSLTILDLNSGEEKQWQVRDKEISSFALSLTNSTIVAGLSDGFIFLVDPNRNSIAFSPVFPSAITAISLHPNNRLAAFTMAVRPGIIYVLDTMTQEFRRFENFPEESNSLIDFFFIPSGELCVITSDSEVSNESLLGQLGRRRLVGNIDIWDVASNRLKYHIKLEGAIHKVIFSADSSWMAVSMSDGLTHLFRRSETQLDLDAIMLIDPDKVTPSATGSGGGR